MSNLPEDSRPDLGGSGEKQCEFWNWNLTYILFYWFSMRTRSTIHCMSLLFLFHLSGRLWRQRDRWRRGGHLSAQQHTPSGSIPFSLVCACTRAHTRSHTHCCVSWYSYGLEQQDRSDAANVLDLFPKWSLAGSVPNTVINVRVVLKKCSVCSIKSLCWCLVSQVREWLWAETFKWWWNMNYLPSIAIICFLSERLFLSKLK